MRPDPTPNANKGKTKHPQPLPARTPLPEAPMYVSKGGIRLSIGFLCVLKTKPNIQRRLEIRGENHVLPPEENWRRLIVRPSIFAILKGSIFKKRPVFGAHCAKGPRFDSGARHIIILMAQNGGRSAFPLCILAMFVVLPSIMPIISDIVERAHVLHP